MNNRHHQALRRQAVLRFLCEEIKPAALERPDRGEPNESASAPVVELSWRKPAAAAVPEFRF